MSEDIAKVYGRVVSMSRVTWGSTLTAAAGIADTVLHVVSTGDFDETGGQVLLGTTLYSYEVVDEDALTVTLTSGLVEAADEDDLVAVVDPEVAGVVVEYVAQVLLDDQDPGDEPIEVTVQHSLVNLLAESVRGGAAESVTLVRDGDDDFMIWQIDGKLVTDLALEEVKGGYPGTLQEIYDSANAAAAAAADAAANATTALTAANGKNKVIYSLSTPGTTPNTAGDIWFRKDSATQTIIGQWQGLGGTSWQQVTLNDAVIANLDAGKIVAGSAFTNALSVKTNFTLGDAATNGVIQSHNFAGSSVGVYIDKFGLVAKGGSIASAAITGATITGSTLTTGGSFPITISGDAVSWGSGTYLQYAGGDLALVNGASAIQVGSGVDIFGTLTLHDAITGAVTASGRVTGDSLAMGAAQTGGTTANTFTDSGGVLFRITSSRRYKYDVETADLDPTVALKLRPTTHRRYDDPAYDEADPEAGRLYLSLIAEEAAEASPWLAVYDDEGRPDGIDWQAVALHTLATVRDLTARIEQLEGTA